ncbi:TolC family protein [Flavobacterium agricola]|uniref:TolC family protein n=1 Tax=Flavobacterium agricola TaxID=2870839 RepID=UPI0029391F93|nr:TolC family protein [Flavobacterium agricola]
MKIKLSLAFILFSALVLQAQIKKISLSEAINYALENKAESKKASLEVTNSEFLIQEARANALPQINATGSLTYNAILQQTALNFNGATQIIQMGRPWQSGAVVSLNQQLFNLAVFTGLKAAKTTREFYQINKNLSDEQVIEKVATSYYEVYKTKSQIETVNRTLANTEQVRDVIQNLYEAGLAKKIDLDRTNVAVNNIKSNKQQLENALSLRENALKYFIGMDIAENISVQDNTFEINGTALLTDVNVNLTNRTEFALLAKQRELLELNKKATRTRFTQFKLNSKLWLFRYWR